MSDISENVKKFTAQKVVDIVEVAVLILLIIFISPMIFVYNQYVSYLFIIALVVLFVFVAKAVDKKFDKWNVPILAYPDTGSMFFADAIYGLFIGIVFIYVLYVLFNFDLTFTLGLVTILYVVRCYRRWNYWKLEGLKKS